MRTRLISSYLLLGVVVLAGAAQTGIVLPDGTFHEEPKAYADGVYCTPKGDLYKGIQTPDHPCACKNMVRDKPGDEGCCDDPVTNDPLCVQWCREDHCSCPKICIPGKADETQTPGTGGDHAGR